MKPASEALAASLSVISRTSRLRSNSRPSSSRLATASRVRARAIAERLLATRLTTRREKRAAQFCGSAIVSVPTGGRKKKLKARTEANEVTIATQSGAVAATRSTTIRNPIATVAVIGTS